MADDSSVTDPTDWIHTSLPSLQIVDSAVRCQVCKDFYTNAVMTKCGHSFCSICIRRSLSAEGKCPACRTTESETNLRRNAALQELVDAFVDSRPRVLEIARAYSAPADVIPGRSSTKRKRGDAQRDDGSDRDYTDGTRVQQAPRRSTRNRKQSPQTGDAVPRESFAHEPEVIGERAVAASNTPTPEADDGLVSCPICGQRMKEPFMFDHVGSKACEANQAASTAPKTPSYPKRDSQLPLPRTSLLERLPQLNYSLFNEKQLRQKLASLGIPTWGSKALLQRRHTEWINLWNSNGDSSRPRTKRELLKELESWERTQGGHSKDAAGTSSTATVMRKDFDGHDWATKNKGDFDDLIARARASRPARMKAADQTSQQSGSEQISMAHEASASNGIRSTSSGVQGEHPHAPTSDDAKQRPDDYPETPTDRVRKSSVDMTAASAPTSSPHSPYIPGAGGTESRRGSASFQHAGFNVERSISAQIPHLPKDTSMESTLSVRSEGLTSNAGSVNAASGSGIRRQPMFTLPPDPREMTD